MNDTSNCLFVSQADTTNLGIVRSVVASVSAFSCIISIVLTLVLKLWSRFTNRLLLYLMILAFIYSLATSFQWVGGKTAQDEPGSNGGCSAVAFFVQYSSWSLLLFTFLLTLVLFLSIFVEKELKYHIWEYSILLMSTLLPSLFVWIPFIRNLYGLSGVWCWIKSHESLNCTVIHSGIIEQIILWYTPLSCLMAISMCLIIMILVKYIYRKTQHLSYKLETSLKDPPELYQRALKEYSPLLFFPFIFFTLNLIALTSRILSTQHIYPLWLLYIHAISDPLWGLAASITTTVYILYKNWSNLKDKYKKWKWNQVDISPLI